MRRASILIAIAWLLIASGCARLPGITSIKATSQSDLQRYLLTHKADVDQFRLRGPFEVGIRKGHELRLSATEHINTDLFLAAPAGKAPLVIFLHGLESSKEAHAYQAMHLASWGMHSITVQLSEVGPWTGNGRTLARVVAFIHRSPETIDGRVDVNRIILVGHSYGASSVAVAMAQGAPAAGA